MLALLFEGELFYLAVYRPVYQLVYPSKYNQVFSESRSVDWIRTTVYDEMI